MKSFSETGVSKVEYAHLRYVKLTIRVWKQILELFFLLILISFFFILYYSSTYNSMNSINELLFMYFQCIHISSEFTALEVCDPKKLGTSPKSLTLTENQGGFG